MIHICILTLNRPEAFKRCLYSILPAVERANAQIHVLMQAGSWYPVEHKHVHYQRSAVNWGCAGGRQYLVDNLRRNHGLFGTDIVVFLDDDLYATHDSWLETLIAPITAQQAHIAGVEPMIVTDEFYTLPAEGRRPDYVSGGWCAVAGIVFNMGMKFDSNFTNYYEDTAFGVTAQIVGFRLSGVSGVALHHEPHPGNSDIFARSREYFIANYAGQLKQLRRQWVQA